MALFYTEFIAQDHANVEATERWWAEVSDCKPVRVPPHWDDPVPSVVTLKLQGDDGPAILLRGRGPVPGPMQEAGRARFFEIRAPEGHVFEIC